MKPIAVYIISNGFAINIYEIIYDIEDKVCYTWVYGKHKSKKCYAIIRHDKEGRAYFNEKHHFYLDKCIKV